MNGWIGKVLRVDLSKGDYADEELDLDLAEKFIGGRGLATKLFFDEVDPKVDPLSPENKLIFMTGPLTGTGAPSVGRYMVVTKSPLTGTVTVSNSGGAFGPELKYAGYDGIIFEGKAPKPVYLWIHNDEIEIRSAEHLWGKDTSQTEDIIRAGHEDTWQARDIRVACIGPAGERLSKIASIINDKYRAAGRGGVGAVMGSKNLKAIAVRGTRGVTVADGAALKEASKLLLDRVVRTPDLADLIANRQILGYLPTRNFQAGTFEGWEQICHNTLYAHFFLRLNSCFSCNLCRRDCGRIFRVNAEGFEFTGEGGESQTQCSLGANCGINDQPAVLKADNTCFKMGIDTISMGGTMACAMELYERGYLPEKDAGYKLNFGNARALVELVEKTGLRQDFGDVLAEGSYRMAEKYGHPELSMSVKKQEFPANHPQFLQGTGLEWATSNRGACHMRAHGFAGWEQAAPGRANATEGKAAMCIERQNLTSVLDSSGVCSKGWTRAAMTANDLLSLLEVVTGAGYTMKSMMLAGEGIWNLERLFNLAAGITAKDDTLPKRILEVPLLSGQAKGQVVRLGEMLPEFYKLRGWNEKGVPTQEKLEELGLR